MTLLADSSPLFDPPDTIRKSAVFSEDEQYRYVLRRIWDEGTPPAMFIGLNPSTADVRLDDPTIRRCIRFARDWGYGGLLMGNIYALRSTDPKRLLTCWDDLIDPRGEQGEWRGGRCEGVNDTWLKRMDADAGITIAAWGSTKLPPLWANRPAQVRAQLGPMHALAFTKDGHPRHPLYVKADVCPVPLPTHEHDWREWTMYEGSQEARSCKTCGAQQWD